MFPPFRAAFRTALVCLLLRAFFARRFFDGFLELELEPPARMTIGALPLPRRFTRGILAAASASESSPCTKRGAVRSEELGARFFAGA